MVLGALIILVLAGLLFLTGLQADSGWLPAELFTAKHELTSSGKNIHVLLSINYSEHITTDMYDVPRGTDVLSILEMKHSVAGKEYAGMGFFITEIDGIKQDESHSWLFFVNGKPASASADNTIVEEDAQIEFRFLSNNEAMKYFE